MCTGTHPFIPVPNTARARLVYTVGPNILMNVFHFEKGSPFTGIELASLGGAIQTNWGSLVEPGVASNVTLEFIECTALDSASAPQVITAVGSAGGNAAAALPNSVTLALKFATGVTGRSNRGRMYIVGLTENEVVGDTVTSAAITALHSAWSGFFAAVEAAESVQHVVTSYCNGKVWRITGNNTPVDSYIFSDTIVDNQRRRLTGRGM